MGILDKLMGREPERDDRRGYLATATNAAPANMTDEQAVQRYQYLLRTAPPEAIEQAHAEAFGKLTPEQRRLVLERLAESSGERVPQQDDPQALARLATRTELRQPGTMERLFGARSGFGMGGGMGMGGGGMGMGLGGMMAGSLMAGIAGSVLGSMIGQGLFNDNDFNNQLGADLGPDNLGQNAYDTQVNDSQGFQDPEGLGDTGFDGGDFGGDIDV